MPRGVCARLQLRGAAPTGFGGLGAPPQGLVNFGKCRRAAPGPAPSPLVVTRAQGKRPGPTSGLAGVPCTVTSKIKGKKGHSALFSGCDAQASPAPSPQKTSPKSDRGDQRAEFRPIGFPAKGGWVVWRLRGRVRGQGLCSLLGAGIGRNRFQ